MDGKQKLQAELRGMLSGMTNSAAIGYMIMAARSLDFDINDTRKLETAMQDKMDWCTEEEAEKTYQSF